MGEIANLFNLIFTFPIFNGLILLYHLFGDFGLSIVVLTLIIKLILFPLTLQQLKSTKATQQLQPLMQEINKKHANDQQAKAAAMQTLYKEYGVNPLAGCLPLLVQLPVLYGLYYALNNGLHTNKLSDINAHLYPFVPHFTKFPNLSLDWFSWLSFLNPILHLDWSWTLMLNAPDPSHILPILAGLATFISLRMAQPKQVVAADGKPVAPDPTQQSMKMMPYIMPFFTVFIGWNFASGLALYWTISSIFQAVQQYFVTGWGALLTTPSLKKEVVAPAVASSDASSNGKITSTATRTPKTTVVESRKETTPNREGAISSEMRTVPKVNGNGNGPSQYTRRQRGGGSASARRRSGSQKAR
ncbi:hypothetical protein KDA_22790 [Dictyobacter alpinus]|uniref:Membrane insertase YidC/Oxa/ALB C-terminal domain-containing protein n=1 Tax=Dictyobacter alpinus TaxID=2014873 RepID=A0A402B629_9CHLR|nr:YidC/Oxa1 family membrane protein insertase [Dictyobacter alpinus]GCE26795.1 hypothetical protein KDA_22790 [Dictyobacter alpinus]